MEKPGRVMPTDKVQLEWETVECPVPGCDEAGPRIQIRQHLSGSEDVFHRLYDDNLDL